MRNSFSKARVRFIIMIISTAKAGSILLAFGNGLGGKTSPNVKEPQGIHQSPPHFRLTAFSRADCRFAVLPFADCWGIGGGNWVPSPLASFCG